MGLIVIVAVRFGCVRCGSRPACNEDARRTVDGSNGAADSDSDDATSKGADGGSGGGAGGTNARNGAHASRAACRIASANVAAGTLTDERHGHSRAVNS